MRRSALIAIVLGGAALIVFAVIFLILRNPYTDLNPAPAQQSNNEAAAPPDAQQATTRELITVRTTPTLGASVGVDGVRLVFLDLPTSTLRVTEYDGTGEQSLSDSFAGVTNVLLSPTRDRAVVQVKNSEGPDGITLIYDLRTRDSLRLEDGISAFDWSPDGTSVAYYVARAGQAPALRVVDVASATPQTLRDNFNLVDPVVDWYDATHVAFWQAPSSKRPSPIVSISVDGRESFELAPAADAQQASFAPDGTHVLVSSNDASTGKPSLQLGDVETRTFRVLPLVTWVNKCTWAQDSSLAVCLAPRELPGGFTFPDDDHDLAYHDELWRITATTGELARTYELPDGVPDASRPFLSDNLARLTFLDRARGALVSVDLADELAPATQPSSASAPATSSGGY